MLTAVFSLVGAVGFSQSSSPETASARISHDSIIEFVTITGNVVDSIPLKDIVVIEKGTQNIAMTDKDGYFAIKIPIEHFAQKKQVFLRFEILNRIPLERKIAANTKHLTIKYAGNKQVRRARPVVEEEEQSTTVSDLIFGVIGNILDNSDNIKIRSSENDSDARKGDTRVRRKT